MAIKKEGFFGTDNLHRAGWTALLSLISFIGYQVYQNIFGPQRVIVETPASSHSGVATTTDATSRQPATEEEIQRAAREAEMINLARKKQGI